MQLSDVQRTELLAQRPVRACDWQVLDSLAPEPLTGDSVSHGLKNRCEQARVACRGAAAGISMFGTQSFDHLTWLVTTDSLDAFRGEIFPRRDSPCGVCFDYRAPQLFLEPHRYFRWMAQAGLEISELLVAPIQGPSASFFGTLWVTHISESTSAAGRNFNIAHEQILKKLSTGIWARLNQPPATQP